MLTLIPKEKERIIEFVLDHPTKRIRIRKMVKF